MAGTQVAVDVPVRLQVMQTSVDEMKRVLNTLKPDSAAWKNLDSIIKAMTSQMEKFQIQTSKSFGSQTQFKQANKTLDQMEDTLARAKLQIEKINFKDLKLEGASLDEFNRLKQALTDIENNFKTFKESTKGELFKDASFKEFAEKLDPNIVDKKFDDVVRIIQNKTKQINSELQKAQEQLNSYKNQIEIGNRIEKIIDSKTGGLNAGTLGVNKFDEFFKTVGGKLTFKPNQRNPFFEWLQESFTLNDSQMAELRKLSASKLNELFKSIDINDKNNFFALQLKNAQAAEAKQPNAIAAETTAREKNERASVENAKLAASIDLVNQKQIETTAAAERAGQAIQTFGEREAQAARENTAFSGSASQMTSQIQSFREQLAASNAQFLQLQRSQQTFNSIKMAITNFMGFNQVLNLTKRAVQDAANHIEQLDTTMNGIAIVTNMTTADLWNQVGAYSEMAQKYGTSIQGAYEVSKIYYQAGYETNDVLTMMNETLKLSKISGLDYATTTDYMMTAVRGFHMEVSEASRVVDVYSALAANTAVSQQELAEAMTKTASSMEGVGATFEEASAMIATMVATTRESANNIGSALKSIGSRYGELTKDPKKLFDSEGEAMSFNKVDEALKSVGISLQTSDHQFRDFTDVILELSDAWNTLDSTQQRYIATQFAGNRCRDVGGCVSSIINSNKIA